MLFYHQRQGLATAEPIVFLQKTIAEQERLHSRPPWFKRPRQLVAPCLRTAGNGNW
jgi:hypothetical protein